ncbi:MAG: hypothetical protein P0S95_06265 [Rhabdochlamydiaceae bacterium]|nr:hypothetical protein [Candidatus Amphrikana amoebophyrae]
MSKVLVTHEEGVDRTRVLSILMATLKLDDTILYLVHPSVIEQNRELKNDCGEYKRGAQIEGINYWVPESNSFYYSFEVDQKNQLEALVKEED